MELISKDRLFVKQTISLISDIRLHWNIHVTGFSSVIPGFPRYSVIGDRRHGVYNLRVSNASLEDDAEYQCQVGPARMNKAIRANARLSVICKYFLKIIY